MTPDGRILLTLTRHFRRAHIVCMASPLLKGPFTVDAYQRLGELGVLREDDRVELIAGQVVQMTPIGEKSPNGSTSFQRKVVPICNGTSLANP